MAPDVQKFLIRRLVARRAAQIVTSVTLQADLAAEKGIAAQASTIREFLKRKGYKWLPRNQKRKYSRDQKVARVACAKAVLQTTPAVLRATLSMSLDGVVLSTPQQTRQSATTTVGDCITHVEEATRGQLAPTRRR